MEQLQVIDSVQTETRSLKDHLKSSRDEIDRLTAHLGQSRSREQSLGQALAGSDAVVAAAAEREKDLLAELEDCRSQISDLFLEIEGIAASDERSKAQVIRTLQQLTDAIQFQQLIQSENSSLKHAVEVQTEKAREADKK